MVKQKETVIAAITAAVTAYLEQEQQAKVAIPQFQPTFEISPWRLYGRQESMRIRSHWRRQMRR